MLARGRAIFRPSGRLFQEPRRRRAFFFKALLAVVSLGVLSGGQRVYSRLRIAAIAAERPYQGTETFSGTLGRRRLYDILLASRSSAEEASLVAGALSRVVDARRLSLEDRYSVVRSTSGRFLHLTLSHDLRRCVVSPGPDGRFRAAVHAVSIQVVRRRAAGTINENLWLSMRSGGVPPGVIVEFADVFQWTVDFLTEVRKGDRFALVWTERRTPEGRVLGRSIRAASYDGAASGRRLAFHFRGRYYDGAGQSLTRMFLRAPLKFSRVSSGFSAGRRHPILRTVRPHHGIDYASPSGTPVSSVADGTVAVARRESGFGNVVKIGHKAGYATLYAHLSRFAPGLRKGARVRQGQVIGYVGSTGLATGPHLHFQIEKDGRWADFLRLDIPFAHSVPVPWRAVFALERDRRLAELGELHVSVLEGSSDAGRRL